MTSFLFACLGSVVFWGVYFLATLFIGTMVLKYLAPKTFRFIVAGQKELWSLIPDMVLIAISIYLFLPFIIICLAIKLLFRLMFRKLLGPACKRAIMFADSVNPSLEVKWNEKSKDR